MQTRYDPEVQKEHLGSSLETSTLAATDLALPAQTGRPSRAEITDAASSGRAECVVVDGGPHAIRAVDFLDDLLTRMAEHQRKKSALLRRLHTWDNSETPRPEAAASA